MADHTIYSYRGKNHIPDQSTLGNYVEKTSHNEKCKAQDYIKVFSSAIGRRYKRKYQHKISKVASVKTSLVRMSQLLEASLTELLLTDGLFQLWNPP